MTSWPLDAVQLPRILVLPPGDVDLGEAEAAIELWEHYSGKALDDDQRLAVLVMMAQGPDGKWAAATTGREKPRQNGKGDEVEVVELWGLVQRGEAILHTVHDAVMLSTQTQQRMLGVLEGHADLSRRVKRTWRGTGQQMIELRNGGVIWYRTRTAKGGLGIDDVDRLVVDEAQEATREHLAAVSPTLLANANPQLNALGTAGKSGVSSWWWEQRRRALSPDPGAFGYIGTTAEVVSIDGEGQVVQEPVDVEDRELWLEVNPAVRAGRGGGMAFLEEQFRRLGRDAFAREHLGVWDPPDDEVQAQAAIPPKAWAELLDLDTIPEGLRLGVSSSPDRRWTYIALCGRSATGQHVMIHETVMGTANVGERVAAVAEAISVQSVSLLGSGAASPHIPKLEAAGLSVDVVSDRDYARSCALVLNGVTERSLWNAGGELLAISIGAARKRRIGHSDLWVFTASDDSTHIAPLEAVTVALHALNTAPEPVAATYVPRRIR